ncbi:hypothetical protein SAMN04489722_105287 [Algibacter lectus]|uniref:Uncharacterized protein n=1 Tax=Algibacter lectus TaxID=221126 RepID=A0A4R8M7U5_9FLAO|nr:hypothetical protein DFQ06_2908 [Algibacter lectus]SFD14120.1 hypothetical protein SAMN04489722_105287 [Algibacter lectus]
MGRISGIRTTVVLVFATKTEEIRDMLFPVFTE